MRVLSVQHYPVFGGPHNEILQLEPVLNGFGVETIVATTDEPGNAVQRLEGNVQVCKLPLRRLRRSINPMVHLRTGLAVRENLGQLKQLIEAHNIDIVKVHGPHNPLGAIAAWRTPAVVTWVVSSTRVPVGLRRVGAQIVSRMADSILVTGNRVIDAYPGLSAARTRTVVYYPPVNTNLFRPRPEIRAQARAQLGLETNDLVVGCVGNINPQKGIDQLIDAFAILRSREPRARLVLVGAEYETHRSYSESVRKNIARHGLTDGRDVVFAGERSDVVLVLPTFDVFALASVPDSEGVPTVILEAMACGLPVVATDVGAVTEVVEHGVTGYVVPPLAPVGMATALSRLLDDRDLRTSMGETARKHCIERFDVSVCAASHVEAYELALRHRKDPRYFSIAMNSSNTL